MIDLKTLQWRLAETIQWCNLHLNPDDPENSLRSPELDFNLHPYDEKGHYTFKAADWQKAVEDIASRRADLLHRENSYPEAFIEKLKTGRILLYFPEKSLTMGATTNESEGFFDLDDTPPWDTWVSILPTEEPGRYFYYPVIICWVPPQFEFQANEGLKVSPDACICWPESLNEKYDIPELKQANLWSVLNDFLTQIS